MSQIVIGGHDRTAKMGDATSGALVLTLKGHTSYVYSASFGADGSRIVTGSGDKTAKVWDSRPFRDPARPIRRPPRRQRSSGRLFPRPVKVRRTRRLKPTGAAILVLRASTSQTPRCNPE
jgi:WD40 repeat protein